MKSKSILALLLTFIMIAMSVTAFAATIKYPKTTLPTEVICTAENEKFFKSKTEMLTITLGSEKGSLKFSLAGEEGLGEFPISYVKYSGKNGLYKCYDMDKKLSEDTQLIISKDGKTITHTFYNKEEKKTYKTVYKLSK